MKKVITGFALLLSFGLMIPAFAAPNARANEHAQGTGTTTPNVSTNKPGVHAGATSHAKRPAFKTVQGSVKAVSGTSLTLMVRSTDYTINTTASTRVIDRMWKHSALTDIQVGDKVRVYGDITGTTIAAQIVRDISLPIASSTASH